VDLRVAVVGAGYAGMAAAVTLAERGVPVTVFESGALPGGRARRVQAQGETLDNGQHILLGAYAELQRLMRLVGVPSDAVLRLPLELRFADGFALRALWLPAPLGLPGGLLAASGLPPRERLGAIRFLVSLWRGKFRVEPDCTVASLLARYRQEGRISQYVWRPLCVSALNTPIEQASAQAFATVLRDAFAGEPGASDLLLPRVDLSRLFPEPACDFVRAHGGEVRMGAAVRSISPGLRVDGETYSRVVIAVGPHQLRAFAALLGPLPEYSYQPIYTCYLQYPQSTKLPYPMLGLAHGVVQWAFDRGAVMSRACPEPGRIACVISAQGVHQQLSQDTLAATCHSELAAALGGLPEPHWWRVIGEKRATISCTPGLRRPGPDTPTPGVVLAGDYTDAQYPPTLEAAVRSGVRAAHAVLGA